jgi:hypothetical protein
VLWQGRWPLPWRRRSATSTPGGIRKRTAFAPPAQDGAVKTLTPRTTQASARPGGREAPAGGGADAGRGLWPPSGEGQRGAVAGAMAPAIEAVKVPAPSPGGNRKRTACPPPARDGVLQTGRSRNSAGQRPTRRPRSARPKGGAGAGRGLWPPAGHGTAQHCGRGDGPCHGGDAVPPPLRAGSGNVPRFLARARRCPVNRQVQAPRKASARPGGGEAPGPRAGRALAGGCGPRLAKGQRRAVGDGPCQRDRAPRNAREHLSKRDQEAHGVSLPGQGPRSCKDLSCKRNPGKRPPGRAPAGGFGHRPARGTRRAGLGR